jgi:hypothetical protein
MSHLPPPPMKSAPHTPTGAGAASQPLDTTAVGARRDVAEGVRSAVRRDPQTCDGRDSCPLRSSQKERAAA